MSGGAGPGAGGTGSVSVGALGVPAATPNTNAPAPGPVGGYSPPPIRLKPAYSQPAPVAAPSETAATAATDPVKKDPLFDNAAIEAGEQRNLRQRRRPLLMNSPAFASSLLGSSGTIFNRKDHGTTF